MSPHQGQRSHSCLQHSVLKFSTGSPLLINGKTHRVGFTASFPVIQSTFLQDLSVIMTNLPPDQPQYDPRAGVWQSNALEYLSDCPANIHCHCIDHNVEISKDHPHEKERLFIQSICYSKGSHPLSLMF